MPKKPPEAMSLDDCVTLAEAFTSWSARTYPTATAYQRTVLEFAFYAGAHSLNYLQAKYLEEDNPRNAALYGALIDEVDARMKVYLDSAMEELLRRSGGVDFKDKPH